MKKTTLITPEEIRNNLERILLKVQKPGRYTGGELNQIVKDWGKIEVKVALVFPDIYDLGMSNLGLAILYDIINKRTDALAERVFCPWTDMQAEMGTAGIPLFSLETMHPVKSFDIVGFSLPYETLYTNALNVLHLADIPLFSADRSDQDPLVIAGGHACYNPEPMHAFIDAFVIGEGEEVIQDIIHTYLVWREGKSQDRLVLLRSLAHLWGVYVPSLYEDTYLADGTFSHLKPLYQDIPEKIQKRIVPKLPPPPTHFIVPYIDITHNRIPIEIMRGCTRGCRFCHAGIVTRPVRERSPAEILTTIDDALKCTGFEEIGLLSLSSSDYSEVHQLVESITQRYSGQHLSISLPSLRIESFSVELMDSLENTRRSGFTLAPEAATERVRETINKPVSTEQVLTIARQIYFRGWTTIKLYFMIGHPSETIEDVHAITDLCLAVLREGRQEIGRRAAVHVGLSTFVPKPHTPFQWVPCDTLDQIQTKQELLKRELRGSGIKLNWNEPAGTILEAWLSRGDRRVSEVIFKAWQNGARFDAWHEYFDFGRWLDAANGAGVDPGFYSHRKRSLDENFPWDHIDTTVRKEFLAEDYRWSLEGKIRDDCRFQCFACGILPAFSELRSEHPGNYWKCPEVIPVKERVRKKKLAQIDQKIEMPSHEGR